MRENYLIFAQMNGTFRPPKTSMRAANQRVNWFCKQLNSIKVDDRQCLSDCLPFFLSLSDYLSSFVCLSLCVWVCLPVCLSPSLSLSLASLCLQSKNDDDASVWRGERVNRWTLSSSDPREGVTDDLLDPSPTMHWSLVSILVDEFIYVSNTLY